MVRQPLFCDACGCATEHQVQESDDQGEAIALCTLCGRLQVVPQDDEDQPPPSPPPSQPCR